MKEKNIKRYLEKVNFHVIQSGEYEELPELTNEMFDRAVYKVNGVEKLVPRKYEPRKITRLVD